MSNILQDQLNAILLDKNTNLLPENLKEGVTCFGVTGNASMRGPANISSGESIINNIVYGNRSSGSGFDLDADGYYVSNNHGHSTYALMRVSFSAESATTITIEYKCYAEGSFDVGMIGNVDQVLNMDSYTQSCFLTTSSSSTFSTVSMEVPAGDHFIEFKYRKDGSASVGDDAFKFKLILPPSKRVSAISEIYESVDVLLSDTTQPDYTFGILCTEGVVESVYLWKDATWTELNIISDEYERCVELAYLLSGSEPSDEGVVNELETILMRMSDDKNTNLLPENLREGVTCLGVTGTLSAREDLEAELSAQENIIRNLKTSLRGKAAGEGGGSSVELNVFMQETEPITYDGIWLQGNNTVDSIIADEDVFLTPTWNAEKTASTPTLQIDVVNTEVVTIGTDIYIPMGTVIYKYDTINKSYSQVGTIPYDFVGGTAMVIGTDIWGVGNESSSYSSYGFKFDTLSGVTEQKNGFVMSRGYPAAAVGTNIYTFNNGYNYKYDTLTNTFTKLSGAPYAYSYSKAVAVGTDIYIVGSQSYSYLYKYDTITDQYTTLNTAPEGASWYEFSLVAMGSSLYMFGGGAGPKCYKYDIPTNTYTQLDDIPMDFYDGAATVVGDDIYLFGSNNNKRKVQVMTVPSKTYDPNTVVIVQGTCSNKTKLADIGIDNLKTGFDRVFYSDSTSALTSLPTYVGNGTEWVQIGGAN